MDWEFTALGLVAIQSGLVIAYYVGRRVERQRCAAIARSYIWQDGLAGDRIADAIESDYA